METLSNNLGAKRAEKGQNEYVCINCVFKCSKKYSWERHILSTKHIKATKSNISATKRGIKGAIDENIKPFLCKNCGNEYKNRTGLWRHKKCCLSENENKNLVEQYKSELIITLLKQNAELIKGQQDMMIKLTENGINNNSHNTNTNSHNKSFNINFFLNETCKNAMNITDFIDSIKLQLSDLMDVGELGYVEGISKIIVKNLKNLDETIRPIHCTDKKRETMYVKDEGGWSKEDEHNTKLTKAATKVADKNIKLLPQFREKYPEYKNPTSNISDKYDKMVLEVMTCDEVKNEKIIKNISKVTIIKD